MYDFIKTLQFRHACKLFDDKRNISKEEFETILEAARLSPSSFGLEPWHLLVVENAKLRELIRSACWDQPQITTASEVVVLLSRKAEFFKKDSEYLNEAFGRKAKEEKMLGAVKSAFDNFITNDLATDAQNWAKMQTYIAGANLMNAAASIGIDTCPIEGFNAAKLTKILTENVSVFDALSYNIAFVLTFGYRVSEPREKIRWPLEKIVTFVK
ncbi:MAG: NAD(P)H-dependent oxidoreductase [Campylobacteraceae bacterium]|jgi:nitroreductase|nr:NAD(P)H-dependent oxidoreductase [Campylobacteraceae bacterium]